MIIVNTTFVTHVAVSAEVLRWIRDSFIPSAGHRQSLVTRILDNPDPDARNFAVHLHFTDSDEAAAWLEGKADEMMHDMHCRWGENALSFSTMFEVI